MKKKIRLLALLLALAMETATFTMPIPAQAAAKVITIQTATKGNAKKIHEALDKQTALVLRVKGNKQASKKLLKKLQTKIKKINKQDVIFQYRAEKQSGNYFRYSISKDYAKQYHYANAFCKKLFKYFKTGKCYGYVWDDGYGEKNGYTQYRYAYEGYKSYLKSGSGLAYEEFYTHSFKVYEELQKEGTQEAEKQAEEMEKNNFFIKQGMRDFYGFKKAIAKTYGIAFAAESFGELSDAMKVWVVAESGYFACNFDRKNPHGKNAKFCMTYSTKMKNATLDGNGLRAMLNNRVQGVCANYAVMECLLWDQWGIHNQINDSWKINHAWSVVKAKNSKGKALWIPFDYRIGPSGIYKASQKEQYRLYLDGVKGAPKYKNFKQSDFM